MNATNLQTGWLVGYARVSTDDQDLALQSEALMKAGVPEHLIYGEHVSGAKAKRPKLEELKRSVRAGDTVVIWKLDRLGRSLKDLIEIALYFEKIGVHLKSLPDSIDTSCASGMFTFHILGAVAEFERALTSERTKAGLAVARAKGNFGGRKPKTSAAQDQAIHEMIQNPEVPMSRICETFGITRSTAYRAQERHLDAVKKQTSVCGTSENGDSK